MKIKKIVALFLLILSCTLSSCNVANTIEDYSNYPTNFKRLESTDGTNYEIAYSGSVLYDKNSVTLYAMNSNNQEVKFLVTYDNKKVLSVNEICLNDSKKYEATYLNDLLINERISYSTNGVSYYESYIEYFYDDFGNEISEIKTSTIKGITRIDTYFADTEYDSATFTKKINFYKSEDKSGNFIEQEIKKYNKDNNIIYDKRMTLLDGTEYLSTTKKYEYDSFNNISSYEEINMSLNVIVFDYKIELY